MHDGVAGPVSAPPRAMPPWRVAAWTLADLLIGATLVFGFGIAAALAMTVLQASGADLGPPQAALGGLPPLFIPVSLFGTLLAGIALWALHRRRLPSAPPPWTPRLVVAVVASATLLQGAAMAFTALMERAGTSATGTNLAVIDQAFTAAPMLTLLVTVLVAPLGEELVFRRVLLHRFAQAGRPWLGLAITSLGFALIHEPLPDGRDGLAWALTLSTYALLGAGFGLLYLRGGRFDAVLLAHVLVNAVGMTLLLNR